MDELEAKLAAVEQRLQDLTARIHERVITKGFDATPGPRTHIFFIEFSPILTWNIGVHSGKHPKNQFRLDHVVLHIWKPMSDRPNSPHNPEVIFGRNAIICDSGSSHTELTLTPCLCDSVFAEFKLRRPKCSVSIGSRCNSFIILKNGTANTTVVGKKDRAR